MSPALKFKSYRSIIFILAFSSTLICLSYSYVYAGGEGGGDGGGGVGVGGTFSPDRGFGSGHIGPSSSSGSVSDGTGGSVVTNETVVDTISTKRGIVAVSKRSDGTYGLSSPERGDGGTDFTKLTPPTGCTSPADIIATDIVFSRKSKPGEYLISTDLDIGYNFIPNVLVVNSGCSATNDGNVAENFRNQPPRGENGTFPVRLQIDFDKDGDIDYDETVNSVGPMAAGESDIVAFPAFLADIEGDHEAVASADPHSMPKVGCSGGWGCVKETNETNQFTLNFSITKPWIDLGSFLYADWQTCNRTDPDDASLVECRNYRMAQLPVKRGLYRDVEEKVYKSPDDLNYEIGLLWDGHKVIYNTCTGNRSDFDGKWHPWALTDGINKPGSRANASFSKNLYDTDIDEPPRLETHVYTITCKTTGGGTVSDTHILNGGADISGFIDLTPTIEDKTVEAGTMLENYNFKVKNDGIIDVNKFTYSFSIEATDVTRGDGSVTTALEVEDNRRYNGAVRWQAPDSDTTVPIKVCITHPDMEGKNCDTARLTVTTESIKPKEPEDPKPECADGEDNDGDGTADFRGTSVYDPDPGCDSDDDDDESEDPTITADPIIVRSGETTTVEWDPRGNTKCELSKNTGVSSRTNSPGSTSVPIVAETIFTISCEDDEGAIREASVTVKALPVMYET